MARRRSISEDEIRHTLFSGGHSLSNYVLLDGNLPCTRDEEGGLAALLIEDDDLGEACVNYLRANGVPETSAVKGSVARARDVDPS